MATLSTESVLKLQGAEDGSVYLVTPNGERLWRVLPTKIEVTDEARDTPRMSFEAIGGKV